MKEDQGCNFHEDWIHRHRRVDDTGRYFRCKCGHEIDLEEDTEIYRGGRVGNAPHC